MNATKRVRARPVELSGICWCCNGRARLYRFSTMHCMRAYCAECCHDFGCNAGETRDGIILTGPYLPWNVPTPI